jgi:competence ComEA-like helix-hairpin-helix protein
MTRGERIVLLRGLALLALAGAGRLVHERTRPGGDPLAGAPDVAAALDSAASRLAADEAARSRPLEPGERIDLNSASEVELDRLRGVGPAVAARIVADRETSGPFASVDALLRVSGIGPATLERLRPQLEARGGAGGGMAFRSGAGASGAGGGIGVDLGASLGIGSEAWARGRELRRALEPDVKPLVDVNRADSAALLTVTGIGPAMAGRILAARRARGSFRSLDDLLTVRGIGERTLERLRQQMTVGVW